MKAKFKIQLRIEKESSRDFNQNQDMTIVDGKDSVEGSGGNDQGCTVSNSAESKNQKNAGPGNNDDTVSNSAGDSDSGDTEGLDQNKVRNFQDSSAR